MVLNSRVHQAHLCLKIGRVLKVKMVNRHTWLCLCHLILITFLQYLQDAKSNLEESLQKAVSRCEEVEKQLVDVHQQLRSLQQERDAVDAQARADKKVERII